MKEESGNATEKDAEVLVFRTGFVGVPTVELADVIRSRVLYIVSTDPFELFIRPLVTEPFYIIAKRNLTSSVDLGVENGFDFVMNIAVDFDRRRRWLGAFGERIREVGFELGDMEYRVNTAEFLRKA